LYFLFVTLCVFNGFKNIFSVFDIKKPLSK